MAQPLRNTAYKNFKQKLFDRSLLPGAFVSQRELCEILDCPMGAVREALKRLEAEGLINLLPQRGIQIADINVKFINEAFQFRLMIEMDAVRRMVVSPNRALLTELFEKTGDLREQALAAQDADETLMQEGLDLDLEFHASLIGAIGNSLISDTYGSIDDRIRLIRLNGRFYAARLAEAMGEHLNIIRALLDQDEHASIRAMDEHIRTSWRRSLGNEVNG